jgi:hypothetical protein
MPEFLVKTYNSVNNNNFCEDSFEQIDPLNAELNPICHFPALVGAHHILHASRARVKYEIYKFF